MTRRTLRDAVADFAAEAGWPSVEAAMAAQKSQGWPPVSGDGTPVSAPVGLSQNGQRQPTVQQGGSESATIGPMPIVIEATLVHYTEGLVFCCAILELDDGFRCPVMVRPPSSGVGFPVGTRVRATKPHAGFLSWEMALA